MLRLGCQCFMVLWNFKGDRAVGYRGDDFTKEGQTSDIFTRVSPRYYAQHLVVGSNVYAWWTE